MSDKKKEATSLFGALGAAVDGFALLGEVVGEAAQTGMIKAAQEGVQMVKGTTTLPFSDTRQSTSSSTPHSVFACAAPMLRTASNVVSIGA